MPKQYINFPEEQRAYHALTEQDVADGKQAEEILPPSSQVGIHWDPVHSVVQLSMDIDLDLLERIVKRRREEGVSDGSPETRQVLYTAPLSRADLQRLVKNARRARNDAFGADE